MDWRFLTKCLEIFLLFGDPAKSDFTSLIEDYLNYSAFYCTFVDLSYILTHLLSRLLSFLLFFFLAFSCFLFSLFSLFSSPLLVLVPITILVPIILYYYIAYLILSDCIGLASEAFLSIFTFLHIFSPWLMPPPGLIRLLPCLGN